MGRRQFGSIRKLPSGRWQARYATAEGTMAPAPVTFRSKADAGRWLAAVEADQARGTWIDPRAGMVSLREYANAWLASRVQLAPRTRDMYDVQLRMHILPDLGDVEIGRLTPEIVRAWYAGLAERRSPSVAAKAYVRLRQILGQAVDDDRIAKNPCRIPRAGVERTREQRFASLEELYELAGAIDDRYRAMVLTAGLGGLRLGELCALRRHDVDLLHATITVRRQRIRLREGEVVEYAPKTVAGRRVVALPAPLATELERHLATYGKPQADAYVFTTSTGEPIDANNFRHRVWIPTTKAVGMAGLRAHDLRHTAGTLAARTGATTKELMARLGHASPRAAMIYQHATDERDRVIAERLADMAAAAGLAEVVPITAAEGRTRRTHARDLAREWHEGSLDSTFGDHPQALTCGDVVVGTGVDPVTSRFSGARSTD
jgi:integrase